ncbi:MAG: hypothetical protein EXS15_07745 [Phycisphaerales bacterium]|nr:hypothetical protein [Phycisphaerales bacterium]
MNLQSALASRVAVAVVGAVVVCVAVIALGGCTANPRPGFAYGIVRSWNKTIGGEVHRGGTFDLPGPGVMDIEVDSFAGNVFLHASGAGNTGTLGVVRRGTHGISRRDESEESLKEIEVTYEVQDRAGRPTLVVIATTTHVEPWFQALDLDIELPRIGVVIVRTSRGHVIVTDFEDGVDIETTGGDVRAATNSIIHLPSTILDKEGHIDWRVPPGSSGAYEMEAVNGEVQIRVREGNWRAVDRRNDHDSNYGILNAGTNRIVLRTVDGDIQAYVGRKPTGFSTFID